MVAQNNPNYRYATTTGQWITATGTASNYITIDSNTTAGTTVNLDPLTIYATSSLRISDAARPAARNEVRPEELKLRQDIAEAEVLRRAGRITTTGYGENILLLEEHVRRGVQLGIPAAELSSWFTYKDQFMRWMRLVLCDINACIPPVPSTRLKPTRWWDLIEQLTNNPIDPDNLRNFERIVHGALNEGVSLRFLSDTLPQRRILAAGWMYAAVKLGVTIKGTAYESENRAYASASPR